MTIAEHKAANKRNAWSILFVDSGVDESLEHIYNGMHDTECNYNSILYFGESKYPYALLATVAVAAGISAKEYSLHPDNQEYVCLTKAGSKMLLQWIYLEEGFLLEGN